MKVTQIFSYFRTANHTAKSLTRFCFDPESFSVPASKIFIDSAYIFTASVFIFFLSLFISDDSISGVRDTPVSDVIQQTTVQRTVVLQAIVHQAIKSTSKTLLQTPEQKKIPQEIVFIDSAVNDYAQFLGSLQRDAEVVLLPAGYDGLAYISNVLKDRSDIDAIHIVSHGDAGQLRLGSIKFNSENLPGYQSELQTIRNALSGSADILLYGCNVSQGNVGQEFISAFAASTKADVAASMNVTGDARQGGDWILETHRGEVQTTMIFNDQLTDNYTAILANGIASISGTEKQGSTLTASATDADGTTTSSFSYQWKSSGANVGTSSSYQLRQSDVGNTLAVTVSYTDDLGNPETVTSAASGVIANINDAPTGSVTVNGTAKQGQTLTANTSSISDVDGLGTFHYQWKSGGATVGSDSSSYQLQQTDVGKTLIVTVTYKDAGGTDENLTSSPTSTVANTNDAPTGSVTISGTAKEDQTLTANTGSISDADGLGTFHYQWKSGGTAVGTDISSYQLRQSDVGKTLIVIVTYKDGGGKDESLTSAATATVDNVNDAPVGLPSINGTPEQGAKLTAVTSGISDEDGLGSFSYQWKRGNSSISGATGSSYTLKQTDVGSTIKLTVSYKDGGNTTETLTSASTSTVTNINDPPSGSVTVSGSLVQGSVLTAETSSITDADGLGSFNYKWFRNSTEISGAVANTYTLNQIDVGKRIKVSVSYLDGGGVTETLTSSQTSKVIDVNDYPVGVPTISGSPTQGQVLSANASGISDADGLGNFSYLWKRGDNNINSATGTAYTLKQADVGQFISVRVRYTDGGSTLESVTSAQTASVQNINDAPSGKPTINGATKEGSVLTAVTTGISDADGLGSFNYQWKRGGANIPGAIADTYALTQTDVGSKVSVLVSYTDDFGFDESVISNQTASIANVNDQPVGQPTISGITTQGQILSANTSGISDADGLGTFKYQWLRDGATINGATGISHQLVQADVGKQVSIRISYIDGGKKAESVTSALTAVVLNINDTPVGSPAISGNLLEGNKLTAVTSGISDIDGLGTFSYQWLRNGSVIDGAILKTFSLTQTDVKSRLSVKVSYQDGGFTQETLTSAQTLPIANTNDKPTGKPIINGSVTEGGSLTADTTAIGDIDGLGTFSYQWLRNGGVIGGATAKSYSLVQVDVGKRIRVKVSYTDGGNTPESITSDQTVAVTNTNDEPVGVPTISGTTTQGSLLTANTSGISDADGLGTFKYQWLRSNSVIAGATSQKYRTVQADVGKNISVRVSYTDGGLTIESIASAPTGVIVDVNDKPVGSVVINGSAKQGSVLVADVSAISDADGLGVFSYQWLRNNSVIPGATASSYTLRQADVNAAIKVKISYTDGGSYKETLVSKQTSTVKNVNDAPVGVPLITGIAKQGVTLASNVSGISDIDGLGTLNYQWLRDGNKISGATNTTYLLTQDDVGALISLRITYKDGGNKDEEITSLQTAVVINVNDLPVGLPIIIGSAIQNNILTADTSGISDEDGLGEDGFSYQWLRNGTVIVDANASTYILTQQDVATFISVKASYTDGDNALESITSAETTAVENVNDLPEGVPVISGNLTQGELLTVITTEITDIDGLGVFAFQWLRDDTEIVDATGDTYTLTQADVDTLISVSVSYVDGGLTEEVIFSNGVGPVINVNDVGVVTIVGDATVASEVPLTVGEIIDIDGTSTSNFIYQWFRGEPNPGTGLCAGENIGVEIAGATSDTFSLTNADLRKCITLRVTYTDDFGKNELIFSNVKGPIFPDVPKVTAPDSIGPIPATGWFTFVDLQKSAKATAKDGLDGVLTPVANSRGQFRPGKNIVTWSATDSAANVGTATQTIMVIPFAEVSKFAVAAEGSETQFVVSLSGDAIEYPVVIPYTVNGSAANNGQDHGLCLKTVSANCVIESDKLQAVINEVDNGEVAIAFNIAKDGSNEGTENIIIKLGTPKNAVLGANTVQTIEISEGNVAPVVNLEASQVLLDISSPTVTAFALASDTNDADVLRYDWSRSDNAIPGVDSAADGMFSFDPHHLTPGIYNLQVDVSDGSASATDTLVLRIEQELPELTADSDADGDGVPDVTDGYGDSDGDGIADYLDAINVAHVIQTLPGTSDEFIMQTEPGLKLSLADISFKADHGSTLVEEHDVITYASGVGVEVDSIDNVGGYFDFTISALPLSRQVVKVVIPQMIEMPRVPVYRKLVGTNWKNFVVNDKNKVASAAGKKGYCPPPGDAAYQDGLKQGHWCLQLTIEDGGPNDSDGKPDQRITDPGGVGRILSKVKVSSGGGGGGSFNPLIVLLAVFILLLFRNDKRTHQRIKI